jgi:hypothetical protein
VYYSISIVVLAEDERGAVRPESPWSHPRRSICFPPGVRRPCARSMQQSLATDGSRSVVLGDAVGTRERKSHCTPTHLALDEGIHHAHARSHVGSTVAAARRSSNARRTSRARTHGVYGAPCVRATDAVMPRRRLMWSSGRDPVCQRVQGYGEHNWQGRQDLLRAERSHRCDVKVDEQQQRCLARDM